MVYRPDHLKANHHWIQWRRLPSVNIAIVPDSVLYLHFSVAYYLAPRSNKRREITVQPSGVRVSVNPAIIPQLQLSMSSDLSDRT